MAAPDGQQLVLPGMEEPKNAHRITRFRKALSTPPEFLQ
jgi:hypothetical protein